MVFSYNWLQEYLKKNLPDPRELERVLMMHAFEVEEVKRRGNDWLLDAAIPANRMPDAGNHAGLAREIASLTKNTFVPPPRTHIRQEKGTLPPLKVELQARGLVPRYAALVLQGVQPKPSPLWLKKRLEALGLNSIDTLVDLTNYVRAETGQPLHAFDYDRIQGQGMKVRQAKESEVIRTLDKDNLKLGKGMLVIEDGKGLIDLAGIKGGKASGITSSTKNIILQAAVFDAGTLYETKKKLNYTTPSADLYAAGLDPEGAMPALERALNLLSKLGGGRVVQVIDIYPKKEAAKTIQLQVSKVRSLLGVRIAAAQIAGILKGAGFKVQNVPSRDGDLLKVQVPSRRRDISIPQDLVEEIGRVYGYEHISGTFPATSIAAHERNWNVFWRERVRDAFKEMGCTELYTYSFIGEQDLEDFGFTAEERGSLVELENPLSEDVKYPRPSLLPNILKAAGRNARAFKELRLFEVGKRYWKEKGQVREEEVLSAVLTPGSFYAIKGAAEGLLQALGIDGARFVESQPQEAPKGIWNPSRSALLKAGETELGMAGEMSGAAAKRLKLPEPAALMQLSFERISQLASEEQEFRPLSKYPASWRDLAILVPLAAKVADVLNVMNRAGGREVRDIDLFDLFQGGSLPENKKSMAFRIMYQSEEKTLTAEEVSKLHEKIIRVLKKNPAWEVRD